MLFRRTFKTDIINYLGQARNYKTYLEICTPTTGGRYSKIDRSRFSVCHRLMYNCPATFDDGLEIDHRSEKLDIAACVNAIRARNLSYDVILVDPWHEYETSHRDLVVAASLLARHGTIVVHDCLPPSMKLAAPHFLPGSWCGVTYEAFIDFVSAKGDFSYYTVDADYGCGIIRRARDRNERAAVRSMIPDRHDPILRRWTNLGDRADHRTRYRFFEKNRKRLLNLVSVNRFKRAEAA